MPEYDPITDGLKVSIIANTTTTSSVTVVAGTVAAPTSAGSAVIMGTQACSEVTIQAPVANTVNVLFGSAAAAAYMELAPGRDFTISCNNVNKIFVKSSTATAQTVNWIARS